MRAFVLDGDENQAVAATRSLARAGYAVHVGSTERWSKSGWSRFALASFRYPSPSDEPDEFLARLVHELRRAGGGVVLPMTERSTIPVSLHRERIIAAGGRLALPPHDVLARVFDKSAMTALARSLGITVPRTWEIDATTDLDVLSRELPYPVVLKPRTSQEQTEHGRSKTTGAPQYARNGDELQAGTAAVLERCSAVLVQEFVEGTGAGYFVLMCHGDLRGEFAHRRIRDVRPTGSGSALRVSVEPSAALRDASLAILRAVGWHGAAMVEYRIRPDGTPVFLEVNGRFWNSLALAVHAGVDFPLGMAQLAADGDVSPLPRGRAGVTCRWFLGDARHLVAVWRGAPAGYPGQYPTRLKTTLAVLSPQRGTVHDNFAFGDPLPELGDWLHFLVRKVPRAVARAASGKRG